MNRREFLGTAAATKASAAPQAAGLTAGFAERDITPAIGMEQPGGYGKVFHRTFHDTCKVRAAVFSDGARRAAVVGVDALVVPRGVVVGARRAIAGRCGIQPDAVMIAASHSHSSGPTGMVLPGEFDHASPLARKLAYEQSSAADAGYLRKVESEIVNGVCQADASRKASALSFGAGKEDKVAFNRRFRMKNGLSYTHPGNGNPDIVQVAGPVDPAVNVVGGWDSAGNLMGCVVNFCCHATTSPAGISANYIYYLEKVIRGNFGQDAIVVFTAGFCGDVTQVDNLSPYRRPSGEEYARFVGGRVGAEAVKVLLSATPSDKAKVEARSTLLKIPRRPPSAARVKKCIETVQRDPKEVGATEWTFAKEIVLLDALIQKEKEVEAEIQAVQIGSAVFLAAPGEMFCQQGLDLRAGSRFPFTIPVELANGCVGYVPTEDAMSPSGGGYETRLTSYSNLVVPAGRRMVETALQLAAAMVPDPVPEPPKAPPFKEAWSYGNVPPELS